MAKIYLPLVPGTVKLEHHLKGPAKRTQEDDRRFEQFFKKMIKKALEI